MTLPLGPLNADGDEFARRGMERDAGIISDVEPGQKFHVEGIFVDCRIVDMLPIPKQRAALLVGGKGQSWIERRVLFEIGIAGQTEMIETGMAQRRAIHDLERGPD